MTIYLASTAPGHEDKKIPVSYPCRLFSYAHVIGAVLGSDVVFKYLIENGVPDEDQTK